MKTAERELNKLTYAFSLRQTESQSTLEKVLITKLQGRFMEAFHPILLEFDVDKLPLGIEIYEEPKVRIEIKSFAPLVFGAQIVEYEKKEEAKEEESKR